MALLRVFAALVWLAAILILFVGWLYDEPLGTGGRFMVILAFGYTALDLIEKAIREVEYAGLRKRRELRRQSRI